MGGVAHPRSRGEHVGKIPETRRNFWLIPARAGNTHSLQPARPRPSAHPRSRGEHCTYTIYRKKVTGSSPLARGTHEIPEHYRLQARLIPARAGNTTLERRHHGVLTAHPRSRGEHLRSNRWKALSLGSSPLARGTQLRTLTTLRLVRLIPARAGNTEPERALNCW